MASSSALDVGRLRLLREVGLRGSIAGAARSVGLTASAVSQQLALLEREAGAPLLERSSRGVELTDAGSALARRAAEVLDVLASARADLDRMSGAITGHVSIVSVASAAATFVSDAVAGLRAKCPEVQISVLSAEPERGLGLLLAGDADVAIVDEYDYVPLALPEAAVVHDLGSEPFVLVRPAGARPRRVPALRDLAGASWVMPPEDAACGRAARAACRTAGFEASVAWRSDDMLLLVRAVADGHGVAMLPRRSVAVDAAGVAVAAMTDPRLSRRLRLVTRAGAEARPAVAAVVQQILASV